jgi:uncharacterized protein (TIGR00369 family)
VSGPATVEETSPEMAEDDHLLSQLGMRDVPHEGADLAVEFDLTPRLVNPRGALQGGLLATLVDVAAGRSIDDGEDRKAAATADLTIHYLRGLTVGPARAVSKVVRRGRTLAVANVEVLDMGTGQLCAVATASFALSSREPASPATDVPPHRRTPGDQPNQEQ